MDDICKCSWKECPIKSDCYRAEKGANELQIYANFRDSYNSKTNTCKSKILLRKEKAN